MKKVLCFVLTALLVMGALPLTVLAADEPGHPDFSMFVNGYEQEDYVAPSANDGVSSNEGEGLPSYYSLRDEGMLPPVRSQGGYGTCWSFAAVGSAESNLIKKGIVSKNAIDTSEMQFLYYTYGKPVDPLGNYNGDYSNRIDGNTMGGGNSVYAVNALARWTGLTKEEVMDYDEAEFAKNYLYADEYASDMNEYNMEGYRAININDTTLVKECLMENGGLACSYFSDDACYSSDERSFYSDNHKDETNHAVMIVGWDDNYSREKFNGKAMPEHDGAWLIRNSWGSWNHDGGYFWMSYEESSLDDTVYLYEMNTSDNFDYNYQYDGGQYTANIKTDALVNVFTADTDEVLKAVSTVFTKDTYVNYSVDIYVDPTGTNFVNTDKPVASAHTEGTTKYAGMYTIRLENPVELKAGDRFAVVVYGHDQDGNAVNMAYDKTYTASSWFYNHSVYEPCEGYYISAGNVYSMQSRGTPRIKAYTDTAGLANPEALDASYYSKTINLTWNAVEGADSYEVYYGSDNGDYTLVGTTTETSFSYIPDAADGIIAKLKVKAVKGDEKSIFSKTEVVRTSTGYYYGDIEVEDIELKEYENKAVDVTFTSSVQDTAVAFKVEDNSIVKVEKDGTITGLKAGTTTITVIPRANDRTITTATVTVTEHTHQFAEVAEIPATCTEDGMTAHTACVLCGEVETAGTIIPAAGHTEAVIEALEPTCTEAGCTEGKYCSVCEAIIVPVEEIPATGHKSYRSKDAVSATCEEDGCTAEYKCSKCNAVLTESEIIPAAGHVMVESKAAKEPTCTVPGNTVEISCKKCGKVETKSEIIPALNHIPVTVKEGKPATCTTGGWTAEVKCTRCEAIINYSNPVYATGHTPVVTKEAVASTCTVAGYTAEYSCAICNVVLTESKELPLAAHKSVLSKEKVKPTCVKEGSTEEYSCMNCGTVIVASSVIPSLGGHKTKVMITAAEPTCVKDGRTEQLQCTVCGEITQESTVIPATGHTITSETTAPTCVKEGFTVNTCTVCGVRQVTDKVAPLGHTDADNNKICDLCGKATSTTAEDEDHENDIEKVTGIFKFIQKMIEFFKKVFIFLKLVP